MRLAYLYSDHDGCTIKILSVKRLFPNLVFFLMTLFSLNATGQITKADLRILKAKEDSLADYSRFLVMDSMTAGRMKSDSVFTRSLVRALQVKNSFYYPFDSILGVSKLYAPDSTFRIFT